MKTQNCHLLNITFNYFFFLQSLTLKLLTSSLGKPEAVRHVVGISYLLRAHCVLWKRLEALGVALEWEGLRLLGIQILPIWSGTHTC